jgi:hypothetical protein
MMTDWIPAGQVYNHVLAIEIVPDTTRKKLTDQIQRGELPAKDDTGSVVPASFWMTRGHNAGIEFDFAKGTATRRDYPISGPANTEWAPLSVRTLKGLQFSARHLFAAWPEASAPKEDATILRKGIGGAPTKYDWATAAGYMAGYVIENDYPTKNEATNVLAKWFKDQGHEPDRRDLQKFIAALYLLRKS